MCLFLKIYVYLKSRVTERQGEKEEKREGNKEKRRERERKQKEGGRGDTERETVVFHSLIHSPKGHNSHG